MRRSFRIKQKKQKKDRDFHSYLKKTDWGYFKPQIRSGLRKCWLGYTISKGENDRDMMVYYAAGIAKFCKQLGWRVCDFTGLDMMSAFEKEDFAKWCVSERFGTEELTEAKEAEKVKRREEERWERSINQWRPNPREDEREGEDDF